MYFYQLVLNKEWQALQEDYYQTRQNTNRYITKPKRIKHYYDCGYDDIVKHLVASPDSCKNFYPLLQQVGLPYQSYYQKCAEKVAKVLKMALFSEQLVLIELPPRDGYFNPSASINDTIAALPVIKEPMYEPDDSWIIVDLVNYKPQQIEVRNAGNSYEHITFAKTSSDEIFLKHGDIFSVTPVLPKVHILLGGKQGHYDLSLRGEPPLRVKKLAQAWLDELSEQLRTGNSPFSIEQDEAMASVINHGFSAQHNPNVKVLDESKCFRPDELIGALFYQLLLALNQTHFITAKQRMGDLAYDDSEAAITDFDKLKQAVKSLANLRHSEGDDKDDYAYHNSDLAKIAKEYLNQPLIHDGTNSDKDYQSKLQAQIKHDTQVDGLTDIENLYFTAIKLLKLLREPGIIKHVETRREYQLKTTKLNYKPIELKALDFIALTLHHNYRYQISAADNSAQFIGRFSLDDKLKIKIPTKYAHITEWSLTATPVENDFVDEFFPTLKNQYQSMLSMPGFTLGESDVGIMYANTMIGGDKSLSNLTASAQVAGGAVSLYLAAAIGATGIGAPLAGTIGFIGLDNLQAGTRSLLSQDTTTTYGAQFLEWAGVPKGYGELVYGLFDISVITKAGYALKATNQVYNVVKVKPIASAKPQQIIKADEVAISVENITKNQLNKIEFKEPIFNPNGSFGAAKIWTVAQRLKYAKLPTTGKIRFVPRIGYTPSDPLPKGINNGYVDRFKNEWIKGPSRTVGQEFEWDVQLFKLGTKQLGWASRDGKHLNVSLDGKITHK
ncbi:polymorphic toxin type 17 domain-containing protein [Orbus wheelerorum]|uniref:polymorphic toxin type 17 domain-containing protein n=1 Tax=Orbus wheelerorum TaxID=3074111 RepID=UPI00370D1E50